MNRNLQFDLVAYGVLLLVSGGMGRRFVPGFGFAELMVCAAGALLVLSLGVTGFRGIKAGVHSGRLLATIAVLLAMLDLKSLLAVWRGVETQKPVAMILTVLLVLGAGLAINLGREKDLSN